MSYTKLNLKSVEDLAPQFGYGDGMESRFARKPLQMTSGGLSTFKIAPGFRMPFGHTHTEQEEVYLVIAGSARVRLGDEVVELGEWDAVRIPPGMWRGVEGGSAGCELIAFGAPDTDNKDVEMEQEWWSA